MYEHGESGFDELVCNEFLQMIIYNTPSPATYIGQFESVLAGKEAQFDQGANDQNDQDEHDGGDNADAGACCQHWKVRLVKRKGKWNLRLCLKS